MAATAPGRRRTPVKILLVDDDPLICMLGRELLEQLGYRVVVAQAGPEALRLYQKRRRPDLVILDYYLPGDDGSEILAKLQDLDPGVRVMLASGFLAPQEVDHLRDRGAAGFIYKPFRVGELDSRIKRVLAGQSGF
jgi:two-component system, cell cycle sensor histidine kinase and response regulator CckA